MTHQKCTCELDLQVQSNILFDDVENGQIPPLSLWKRLCDREATDSALPQCWSTREERESHWQCLDNGSQQGKGAADTFEEELPKYGV